MWTPKTTIVAIQLVLAGAGPVTGLAGQDPGDVRPEGGLGTLRCGAPPAEEGRCVARLVPRSLTEAHRARMSPDARRFVFPALRGRDLQLRLHDVETGETTWLTRGPGKRYDPVWSPDGTRVVFWGEVPDAFGKVVGGIGVVDVRTGEERLVFRGRGGFVTSPSWTPQGRIVFQRKQLLIGPATSSRRSRGRYAAGRSDADGAPRPSLGAPPPGAVDRAGHRPRSRSGAGSSSGGGAAVPDGEMWIMDADGLHAEPYRTPATGRIAFSPDGERIAWTAGRCRPSNEAAPGLCVAGRDGADARRVLRTGDDLVGFAWAPDGRTLYYAGSTARDETPRLYAVDVTGTRRPRTVASPGGRVTELSVGRTGKVSLSVHRPDVGIATVPVAGGVPAPVPLPDSVHGFWPVWRPDGRGIGFTATPWPTGAFWSEASFVVAARDRGRASAPLRPAGGDAGVRTLTGAWSPDGDLFASYQVGEDGSGFRLSRAARIERSIAHLGPADWHAVPGPPAWSPDGGRVVFAPGGSRHQRTISSYLPRQGLIVAEVDSGLLAGAPTWEQTKSAVQLDGYSGTAQQPRWSPGGGRIAYSRRIAAGDSGGIYVVGAGGGQVTTVAEFETGEMFSGPEWGPDGRSLYYARPDGAGVYRIYRSDGPWTRSGDRVDQITRGVSHALHPRLSPDGETLAVTLWDAPTELWVLPSRTPGVELPPVDTAPLHPPPESAPLDSVSPGLLQLVVRAEQAGSQVRGLWPGFWDGEQMYAVRAAGEPREALVVTPGPRPAGYRPVASRELPPTLEGRLYHATGEPAYLHWLSVDIPVHEAVRDSTAVVRELEERLYGLFREVMLGRGLGRGAARVAERAGGADVGGRRRPFECRARGGCDGGLCAAVIRVENRLLRKMLIDVRRLGHNRIEGEELKRRLHSFAAVRWMRTLADSREPAVERKEGVSAWVARQAALLAVGRDTSFYDPGSYPYARLPRSDEPLPELRRRAAASGQAIAELLDELGPGWRREVRDGATLVEAMMEVTGLTEAQAPVVATGAIRERFDLEDRLRTVWGAAFYTRALCNLVPPVRRIEIVFPNTHPVDGGKWVLRWDAGETGAARPVPGRVFLPRPERFVLEIPGVRAVVGGQPVAVVHGSRGVRPSTRIVIYPSRELGGEIRPQRVLEEGQIVGGEAGDPVRGEKQVRGGGVELRIGPGMDVVVWESRIEIRP